MTRWTAKLLLHAAALVPAIVWPIHAGSLPVAKPEEVGLSSERLQRIHEMVMRRVDGGDLSGAVTIVARKGRVVHFEAHGLMDLDSKKPMTRDALFRLASSSKPVTAVAVLILLEEGKLKLTDPVSKYIPEFKNPKVAIETREAEVPMSDRPPSKEPQFYTVPANREITIVDLLTHTSGLGSGGAANPEYQKVQRSLKSPDTLADFIRGSVRCRSISSPARNGAISGLAAFDTLARVVEVASGMNFDQFLRTKLFEPLGMSETWFHVPEKEASRMVTIYNRMPKGLEKPQSPRIVFPPGYFSGAGGLTSTAEDYLKFAQMLSNCGQLNGKRILSPWTVNTMLSNNVGDLFNGQIGRPPKGMGFGLGGEVIMSAVEARMLKPDGSYGWDGAFGTYWWVNRKEQMVALIFVQTPGRSLQYDFDNAVSQAVLE